MLRHGINYTVSNKADSNLVDLQQVHVTMERPPPMNTPGQARGAVNLVSGNDEKSTKSE